MKLFPLIFLFGFFCSYGQQEIDSLLRKANFDIYEHPGKAIEVGIKVLKSSESNEKQKIEALFLISTAYSAKRNYPKSLEYAVQITKWIPKSKSDALKINAYTRLGLQYQQLQIYNEAHAYLDKAIKIAETTSQKFRIHELLGFNYAVRALIYKEQMNCGIAQNYFNRSLFHLRQNNASINAANASVITYNKGNCFLLLNEIDSARISFTTSLEYAKSINANSLKAFANKGLSEVETASGNYSAAIKLLSDAEKMSENVGDLVLNQGIYKGLSDNYLLNNSIAEHKRYNRKYDDVSQLIKENNAKTLNQFVRQISTENEENIAEIRSKALFYKIPILLAAALLTLLIIYEILRGRRKYRHLKVQKETLENFGNERPK